MLQTAAKGKNGEGGQSRDSRDSRDFAAGSSCLLARRYVGSALTSKKKKLLFAELCLGHNHSSKLRIPSQAVEAGVE